MRCFGWAYGCTLMLIYLLWWGVDFWYGWVWPKTENEGTAKLLVLWCHDWGCKLPLNVSLSSFTYPNMTVKLMPGGVWCWWYTRMAHAPRHWSWISQPTSSSCINRRSTTITSRYASRVQHLIPFQNSRGIIPDTVVGSSSRGRLLGREPSLRSSIATLFCIPRLRCMKTPVWLNLSRY